MRHPVQILSTAFLLAVLAGPAFAQRGKLTTEVRRDSSNHTTIVIRDTRPEAYTRQRDAAIRAQQERDADAQRRHEIELAKIEADARVRVARAAQTPVVQQAAPAPVYNVQTKPSYRNGGYYTGFSDVYFGGFGGYGYGFPAYGYGGGGYGYGRNCAPRYAGRACGPAYRGGGGFRGGGGGYRGGGGRCR